ncbi:Hsp70 family protein-like protein [Acephala macrosclerotiorum]|nr:Hsp70 family protein-like protein [Acephala macrosclerotiorum]
MRATDRDSGPTEYQTKEQLVIALDFGTTYSGIAYAFKKDKMPVAVCVIDWPGSVTQPKIPTVISYDPNDNTRFTWGTQKHNSDVLQGIKLLLDPDQPRPIYLPELNVKSDLQRIGKTALDITADYMGAIYKHAMYVIRSKVSVDYLDVCQKQFVLSVPAVWSDKAKDVTLQAAEKAGIYPITLIKEPEAAAMYTLHTLQDKSLAVGDAFVICDAGGGTVDLISYEITQLNPQLEVKELVPGKGGMAGSLGLNKRFEEAVKYLVGEDQFFTLRKSKGFELAVQQFDRSVKTAFRGDTDEDYWVNFPMANLEDNTDRNLISNCWNMNGEDVRKIFDPLVVDIERLVAEQVTLAIFLVGGFGSSEYLRSRLQAEHTDIQVIQPHGAWEAIVKGACLSQLPQEAQIVSNQATRHYGVSAHSLFDEVMDRGQMKWTWYVTRGQDLKRDHTIRFSFYRSLADGYSNNQLVFTDELFQSESKLAPMHPSSATTKVNCTLTADLRTVNRNKFKKSIGADGATYYQVHYELAITIQSAMMKFSLEIDGKEMGTVNAKYD